MAAVAWITVAKSGDIRQSLDEAIQECGFKIDHIGSTQAQIAAVSDPKAVEKYWSGVRLAAYWKCRSDLLVRIEVRSDEPTLLPGNHCEQRAKALMFLLPPV